MREFEVTVTEMLKEKLPTHPLLVTMEENVASGGFGEHVQAWVQENFPEEKVLKVAIPDTFVPHGSPDLLKKSLKIDADSVTEKILAAWKERA